MSAAVGSPNWGWAQIGYSVEWAGPKGLHRVIKDTAGAVVLQGHDYDDEIAWLLSHAVIDGKTVSTESLRDAINAAHAAGNIARADVLQAVLHTHFVALADAFMASPDGLVYRDALVDRP